MAELNFIMGHKIDYEYRLENDNVILNRDALNLIDRIGASVYLTYLDQQVLEKGQFFVANIKNDKVFDNYWAQCKFRRLKMGDVQLQVIIQRMGLELIEGY